jgi:hydroxypyruvate isomerase
MRIQQSVCYPIAKPPDMNVDRFFGEVAAIGYRAVEMWGRDGDFPAVMKAAAKHGLKVVSMIGVGSLDNGLNCRENHVRIEAELRESINVAADHGIPGLICFSGNRRPQLSDEEGALITAEGLRRIAPYAEQKGVNLNLELLNSKVDHKGYQCDHTAWAVSVHEQVKSPRVKILYDIYHMQIMEGDVIRTIRETIARIGHFHTAGVPGRNDMDDTQELNYRAIAAAISATGYSLYVGHEFSPKGDALAALKNTFDLFDVK